ncbi:hypothetical protein RXV86_08810 [Alisedimentitalea sp. MJ-SS2]|uniref:hypothetical protein n=1 Tax=Aliisedimentitalea sp. MJ-SS2 TaxID=3049795 RepID=UPI00290A69D9|nr:hypothetical protein [Alisedimentitalea sp. MJ-SS2]MDU8927481.1 hypothetical protein [Alisedimentitalea sp. MJ-SS2]
MAVVAVGLSTVLGMLVSLVALIGFGTSLSYALGLYLVSSIVPAALVMAGYYLHMQLTGSMTAHKEQAQPHHIH